MMQMYTEYTELPCNLSLFEALDTSAKRHHSDARL
jgi:hypothetical protein